MTAIRWKPQFSHGISSDFIIRFDEVYTDRQVQVHAKLSGNVDQL
jgi:hypothetical protein